MQQPPKEVAGYLAIQPADKRAALEQLRALILSVAPADAEEVISYAMPALRYKDRLLVAYAGFKIHCGFYPGSGSAVEKFLNELKGFSTTKGAIQFTPEKPVPEEVVIKIVQLRAKENEALAATKKAKK